MEGEVINKLSFGPVQRRDQDTLLVCEISNNNITTPLSAAVQLDMICKYSLLKTFIQSSMFSVTIVCKNIERTRVSEIGRILHIYLWGGRCKTNAWDYMEKEWD